MENRRGAWKTIALAAVVAAALLGCKDTLLEKITRDVQNLGKLELTVLAGSNGSTDPSGVSYVLPNAATAISAMADSGYRFDSWGVLGGDGVSIANAAVASTTVTLTTESASVQANFVVYQPGDVDFSHTSGVYTAAQTIYLSTTTAGATIRFTTDGVTVPTETTGSVYDPAGILLSTPDVTTTIIAVAFKDGMTPSNPQTHWFKITGTVATPVISPAAANPSNTFTVSISTATTGATIRYTTDGSAPTSTTGTVYGGSFTVSRTLTVRAIAYKTDWANSTLASQGYIIAWARAYGSTSYNEAAHGAVQASDGSYFMVSKSSSATTRRLSKISLDGTLQWTRYYTQAAMDFGTPIATTVDGGVITTGGHYLSGSKNWTQIVKINSDGTHAWTQRLTPNKVMEAQDDMDLSAAMRLTDGSFAFSGDWYGEMAAFASPVLVRTYSNGASLAAYRYGMPGSALTPGLDTIPASGTETGFVIAGYLNDSGTNDGFVIATDLAGNASGSWRFVGSSANNDDRFYAVKSVSAGGFVVAGTSKSISTLQTSFDAVLLRLTSAGAITWAKYLGTQASDDAFYAVEPTADGGFIVAGNTASYGAGGKDAWVLKLDFGGSDHVAEDLWRRVRRFGLRCHAHGGRRVPCHGDDSVFRNHHEHMGSEAGCLGASRILLGCAEAGTGYDRRELDRDPGGLFTGLRDGQYLGFRFGGRHECRVGGDLVHVDPVSVTPQTLMQRGRTVGKSWILAFVLTAAVAAAGLHAQDIDLHVTPSLALPIGGSGVLYGVGGGAELSGTWALPPLPLLHVGGAVGYYALPTKAGTLLSAVAVSAAAGVRWEPVQRVGLLLDARAGTYVGVYGGEARMNFFASAAPGVEFQLVPAFRLGAGAEFIGLLTNGTPLYTGVGVRLSGVWVPTAQKPKGFLFIEQPELVPVFPILFKYYDTSRIGTVRIENRGKQTATNLTVSLLLPEFMDTAKESPPVAELRRGESTDVPLFALFSDRILTVTEGTKVPGILTVTYSVRDNVLSQERTESIRIYDRNAMTWDDDRKVAAFVTAKDPAVLRFAKEIAGGVREDDRQGGSLEFRVAMALFQGLAAYGVNYVVDPGSSYASKSASDTEVDFIQFPRQTLQYRSGDCDDLTILYCALMEAVGIETAFITVPGHIYSALQLPMPPQEVAKSFQDSSKKFIVKDGKAYLPVETTMISKGFVAAWERGIGQWAEAGSKAALYPVREAWKTFESVGIREADPSLIYPDWNATLTTYGPEYQKFVLADLNPQVEQLRQQMKSTGRTPRLQNRLGVLYARYGMYNEAEKEFKGIIAASEYAPALMNLGNIALLRRSPDTALGFFNRARKSDARNPAVLAGIARALYDQKKGADAMRTLDQLAQIDAQAAASLSYIRGEAADSSRAAASGENRPWSNWVE